MLVPDMMSIELLAIEPIEYLKKAENLDSAICYHRYHMAAKVVTSSNKSSATSPNCLVCLFPVIPGTSPICQACRKFYRRCRLKKDGPNLRCISGTFLCNLDASRATTVGSGVRWRRVCQYCRFAKCNEVGIERFFRSYSLLPPALAPINSSVTNYDCQLAENAWNKIANATMNLSVSLSTVPLRTNYSPTLNNEFDAWQILMDVFQKCATAVRTFISAMPGYEELPVVIKGNSAIFAEMWAPVVLTESNRINTMPCSISPKNADYLATFLPEIVALNQYCWHLSTVLSGWNPNFEEFACLLADLYKTSYCNWIGNSHRRYNIELVIEACLARICSDSSSSSGGSTGSTSNSNSNERRRQLHFTANTAWKAATYRNLVSSELAKNRPHLFNTSPPLFNQVDAHCHRQAAAKTPSTPEGQPTTTTNKNKNNSPQSSLIFKTEQEQEDDNDDGVF